jgi:hypothetical protein
MPRRNLPRDEPGNRRRLGWQETEVSSRRKHDPGKVQIALRLRQETTLSVKQIAARLHFGTPKSASFCLLMARRRQSSNGPGSGSLALRSQMGNMEA